MAAKLAGSMAGFNIALEGLESKVLGAPCFLARGIPRAGLVNRTPSLPGFCHSVIQDRGKRTSLHKDRCETFAGNAGILQFFGNNDPATTVYVSKRLGTTRVETMRLGETGREQQDAGTSGRSSSIELNDVLTPTYCRVVRHRKLYTYQLDDGLGESPGGPKTEVENRLHH